MYNYISFVAKAISKVEEYPTDSTDMYDILQNLHANLKTTEWLSYAFNTLKELYKSNQTILRQGPQGFIKET
jgi:hypothetical protein